MNRKEEAKNIAEFQYDYIGTPEEKRAFKQGVQTGIEWADKHPDGSVIKWKNGEPKERGAYIVTLGSGEVCYDFFCFWRENPATWQFNYRKDVIAWCKLSDIKPYKEDEK